MGWRELMRGGNIWNTFNNKDKFKKEKCHFVIINFIVHGNILLGEVVTISPKP